MAKTLYEREMGISESSDFIFYSLRTAVKGLIRTIFWLEISNIQIQTNHPVNWSTLLLFLSNYLPLYLTTDSSSSVKHSTIGWRLVYFQQKAIIFVIYCYWKKSHILHCTAKKFRKIIPAFTKGPEFNETKSTSKGFSPRP